MISAISSQDVSDDDDDGEEDEEEGDDVELVGSSKLAVVRARVGKVD